MGFNEQIAGQLFHAGAKALGLTDKVVVSKWRAITGTTLTVRAVRYRFEKLDLNEIPIASEILGVKPSWFYRDSPVDDSTIRDELAHARLCAGQGKNKSHHFFVPFLCPNLTGRNEDLERLRLILKQDNAAITGAAALTGQGGIGKTQLAVAYAYRYGHEFDGVFWLPGHDPVALIQTMAGFAMDLELGAASGEGDASHVQARQFFGWMRRNPNILLIIDDIQESRFLVQDLPGLPQCRLATLPCRLLTTTRLSQPAGVSPVPLHLLSAADAQELLVGEAKIDPSPDTQIVVLLLGRLPLAIKLAAGFLRFTKSSVEGLIEVLHRAGITELESQTAGEFRPFDYDRPVRALLEESCRTLRGFHGHYAKRLLQILALLPVNRIHSSRLIRELLPLDSSDNSPDTIFNGSVNLARERNLLEVTGEGGLRLHPIIHGLLQSKVPKQLGMRLAQRAARQFRETNYLRTLDAAGFLALAQDIPMLLPLGDAESEVRLRNLSRLIDLQFHAIQMGADPLGQLQFQAAKMGDQVFAETWEGKLQRDGANRLLLRWTTAQPTPALMRVLVSMSSGVFGFGLDTQSDLVAALVNGGDDRDYPAIRLWRTAGNDPDNPFLEKEEPFQVSALVGSGRAIVTVDTTGLAKLWDVATGVERSRVRIFKDNEVSSMELWGGASIRCDHVGQRCLVLGRTHVWLVNLGQQKVEEKWKSRSDKPYSLYGDISADGSRVVVFDGRELLLQQSGKKNWNVLPVKEIPLDLRMSRDGGHITFRVKDHLVQFALQKPYQIENSVEIDCFGPPFCYSIDTSGKHALVGYTNGVLGLFDLASGTPQRFIFEPGGHVMSCVLADDHRFGLAETTDNSLRLWDMEKAQQAVSFEGKTETNMMCAFRKAEHGEQLVTLDLDGIAHFWDIQSGKSMPGMSVRISDKGALAGTLSADGSWICAIGQRGRLQAFNTDNRVHKKWKLPRPKSGFDDDLSYGDVLGRSQMDDGEGGQAIDETDFYIVSCQTPWAAVMIAPQEVFITHLEKESRHYTLNFEDDIFDLAISPCGQFLGVLINGGIIEVMELTDKGKPKRKQRLQTSKILSQKLCLGPDGNGVAIGHLENGASILASDSAIQNSFDTKAETIPLEFSMNGENLLMIEGDDKVIIAPTQETEQPPVELFVGNVRYARMSQDGNRLAVLGNDGSIYLFDIKRYDI